MRIIHVGPALQMGFRFQMTDRQRRGRSFESQAFCASVLNPSSMRPRGPTAETSGARHSQPSVEARFAAELGTYQPYRHLHLGWGKSGAERISIAAPASWATAGRISSPSSYSDLTLGTADRVHRPDHLTNRGNNVELRLCRTRSPWPGEPASRSLLRSSDGQSARKLVKKCKGEILDAIDWQS
ncbi:hypothetical protein ACVIDN_007517 [Rhizobium brockwellii]